jgi:hypothetical protein
METAEAVLETAAVTDMIGVRLIAKTMAARVSSRRCPRCRCITAAAAAAAKRGCLKRSTNGSAGPPR